LETENDKERRQDDSQGTGKKDHQQPSQGTGKKDHHHQAKEPAKKTTDTIKVKAPANKSTNANIGDNYDYTTTQSEPRRKMMVSEQPSSSHHRF
jgi:hypothetical protein